MQDNRPALDCYFRSIPERRGYRQRMIELWNERGMFKITEQRMADQERAIPRNHWFTNVELEDLRRCASRSPSTVRYQLQTTCLRYVNSYQQLRRHGI